MNEAKPAVPMNDRERLIWKAAKKDQMWMIIGVVVLAIISVFMRG